MADYRVMRVPDSLGNGLQERVGTDFVDVALNVTTADMRVERFAGGANGQNGGSIWARNATVTQTATGRFTVAFNQPHADGVDYHVSLSGMESITERQNPKVVLVRGTKSSTGFDVMVTQDDNGGSPDAFDSNEWSFSVAESVSVVTAVVPA